MSVPYPLSAAPRSADPADLPPAPEGVSEGMPEGASEGETSCHVTRSGELAIRHIPLARVKAALESGRFLGTAHMGGYGQEFAMRAFVRRL